MEYRVIKIEIKGYGVKYCPQYKIKKSVISKKRWLLSDIYKSVDRWKRFYEIRKGTDEFIPCYYDTIEEAWDRIDKRKENLSISERAYNILEYYYE